MRMTMTTEIVITAYRLISVGWRTDRVGEMMWSGIGREGAGDDGDGGFCGFAWRSEMASTMGREGEAWRASRVLLFQFCLREIPVFLNGLEYQ